MTSIQMCRTCLAHETHDSCMYTIAGTPLQEFYEKVTNLALNTEDNRPSVVCFNCCQLLETYLKFTENAIKADAVLRQICKSEIQLTEPHAATINKSQLFNETSVSQVASNAMSENMEIVNLKKEIIEIKTENEEDIDESPTEDPEDMNQECVSHLEIKIETKGERLNLEDKLQLQDYHSSDDDVPLENISIKKEKDTFEKASILVKPELEDKGTPGGNKSKEQKTNSPERLELQSTSKEDTMVVIKDVKVKGYRKKQRNLNKKIKEYACNYCEYKSARKYCMTRHNQRLHSVKILKCEYCDYKSAIEEDMLGHIRKHTGERPYSCDYCDKKFTLKRDLSRHIRMHTDDNGFTCSFCGNQFTQKCNLLRHLSMHKGEKPYTCDYCGNKFSQKSNLSRHIMMHNGEKPFLCSYCDKKFPQKIHLTQHLLIHTGVKPFECNYCGRNFSQKKNWISHVRLHRGEKPFTCDYCESKFTQKNYLTRHLKSHKVENLKNTN